MSDPNTLVCMFRVEDVEKSRAFTEAPEASDAQKESGMSGKRDVLSLEHV
ncbi:hypothetical protein GWO43_17560 [candidate division KSB1 bacterium]|nr:hypothetical protein [candidate division KSB1 bacterium]NIT72645.1 hypothetical protein [candidate division KSB1 bacterium]NIX72325.1 hypothetical protein [candidate division KSB1 bacterium]